MTNNNKNIFSLIIILIIIIIIIHFSYLTCIKNRQFFLSSCFVFQITKSIVNWKVLLPESYQIIWDDLVQKLKHVRMNIILEKWYFVFLQPLEFLQHVGCIDGKHSQLKFLLISGYMILVESVSDCLKMERGSSSSTYVASRKLLSEHWQLL